MNQVFFASGYPCLTIRTAEHFCGYVGIGKNHPYYRLDFGDANSIEIHGGLTFSGDRIMGMKNDSGLWFFGFDTGHGFDDCDTNNEQYVVDQCKFLAEQLFEAERDGSRKVIRFKDAK